LRLAHGPSLFNHGLSLVDVPVYRVSLGIVPGLGFEVGCTVVAVVAVGALIVSYIVILASRSSLLVADANAGLGFIVVCFGRLFGNQLGNASLCFFGVDASFFFVVSSGPVL
jgi:hypothetical protein